jgi:hypothetical protein
LKVQEKTGEPVLDEQGRFVLKDPMEYHKYLCKYPGSRGLFGLLLLSPQARDMLTNLTKEDADVNRWESIEEVCCYVAKYVISKYGLKELGLTLLPGADERTSREHYFAMFDMWLLRKNGAKPEVVAARKLTPDLGRPARMEDVKPLENPEQVNAILAEHTKQTEGFMRTLISRSLLAQATDLTKLEGAAKQAREEGTPEGQLRAQVLEAQMKRIFFRLAATWFRMKREVQTQILREATEVVMKESPSVGSDWLYALAAIDKMEPQVVKPDGTLDSAPLAVWQPRVVVRDDENLNQIVEQLQARARDETTPKLFDSKLGAGWD